MANGYASRLPGKPHRLSFGSVAGITIELPPQQAQTESNLRRWTELQTDQQLAKFEGRVETDRYGRIIMSPPPAPAHGGFQSLISYWLNHLMRHGRVYRMPDFDSRRCDSSGCGLGVL